MSDVSEEQLQVLLATVGRDEKLEVGENRQVEQLIAEVRRHRQANLRVERLFEDVNREITGLDVLDVLEGAGRD